jgi:hypothetical protein
MSSLGTSVYSESRQSNGAERTECECEAADFYILLTLKMRSHTHVSAPHKPSEAKHSPVDEKEKDKNGSLHRRRARTAAEIPSDDLTMDLDQGKEKRTHELLASDTTNLNSLSLASSSSSLSNSNSNVSSAGSANATPVSSERLANLPEMRRLRVGRSLLITGERVRASVLRLVCARAS